MLIYEQNSNILPLVRKVVERMFNRMILRFGIDDKEVLLSFRRLSYMLLKLSAISRSTMVGSQRDP